jgi:asparagine synthase (glutamine-hydrolysing)
MVGSLEVYIFFVYLGFEPGTGSVTKYLLNSGDYEKYFGHFYSHAFYPNLMCGLAGWFGPSPDMEEARTELQAMTNAIRHRGPDGEGVHVDNMAALGHVRLAIIDPAGGAQPLMDQEGRGVIAYNGEAYNYPELREELISTGYRFKTHSDTETVLALYLRQGLKGVARLTGMYAFAIWEPNTRRGVLVRDRQGIKPLFYCRDGERLFFASEAKALLPVLRQRPGLDLTALHLLLNFRYIPGDKTLFPGIRQLNPGEALFWQDGTVRRELLAPFPASASRSPGHDEVREEILAAVQRHLVADVPVGGYLSAGVDSATIAAAVRLQDSSRSYPTFTLEIGDHPAEADGAEESARILGLENQRSPAPADFNSWFPQLIAHLETPKVNAFQAAAVAQLASRQVKVALSGLGADEIFLGYTAHRYLASLSNLRHGPAGSTIRGTAGMAAAILPFNLRPEWEEAGRGARMVAAAGRPEAYGILRNVWDSPEMRRRIYGPRLLDADLPNAFEWLDSSWPKEEPDFFQQSVKFENRNKLVNDFLWQEDRMSMAFGLEVRTPFLDERLNALVSRLSWQELMSGGKAKAFMRQVVAPWLPTEILERPKSGFQVNAADFFSQHLRPMEETLLSEKRLREDGLFNPQFVRDIFNRRSSKALRWHYFLLYLMAGSAVWMDLFDREK